MNEDLFRPAKLLVTLASAELDEFQARCDSFVKECKIEIITDNESDAAETIGKARIQGVIPDILERDSIRFVSDLRSALDKATNAASKMLGSTDLAHTHFPLGESEGHFSSQLRSPRGPWGGIPSKLHDYLKALKPYWGGNDLLRAFGGFSNPTKHESVLTVNINLGGIGLNPGPGGVLDANFSRLGPVWGESKTECEIFRIAKYPPPNVQIRVHPSIAFNDAKGLTRKEFVPTIRQVAGMVKGIVLGLEAETSRLLSSNP